MDKIKTSCWLPFFFGFLTLLCLVSPSGGSLCVPSCANATADGERVVNPSNCSQYFLCSDGDLNGVFDLSDTALNCTAGTYFNADTKDCETIPTDGSNYCPSLCNPCEVPCDVPGSFAPDPLDCNKYSICLEGNSTMSFSCPTGMFYNYVTKECDETNTGCYNFCDSCTVYCVEEGRLPDPYKCEGYYYCNPPDELAHFTCDAGEYFYSGNDTCISSDSPCTNIC